MDLQNVKSAGQPRKSRKRVGRGTGSGHGKTSGRGHKGFGARGGKPVHAAYIGGTMPLTRRLPRRGFNNGPFRKEMAVVNVSSLNVFEDGVTVGPADFLKHRIINQLLDGVKILGNGELSKKLVVKANYFSKSAEEKIKAAGGTVEKM